ncbi:DNAse [Alkalilimnicola ehrlichii]|uniref:DNAse n=1 Tax=Alkalilimnicola ehrlichii TaxID=351052 RepID=A0A3E0X2K4_9GAMM|nr:endonuclease/exonuclease/phosphatase family protein [Alkalilimnicola ehrlichii]RFA30922.1 DNAse [Alkalilimnicola ehrlichii]RFA38871.1 DNAse [Alkalilimnicola ehrlichii]
MGSAWFSRLLLVVFLLLSFSLPAAELRVASWNIERLGHGNQKSYPALAEIAGRFDFLAIQEVMTAEGIQRLQRKLEQQTGEPWGLLFSEPLGRSTYREKYAFLWRESRVEYVDGAVVYIDDADAFAREPFSARFAVKGSDVTFRAATVHIVYGRYVADRTEEVIALRGFWDWLVENFGTDDPIMLLGDFNLAPDHTAWAPLREVAAPLITEGASTLSSHDGHYANLYDNIWLSKGHGLDVSASGVFRFPALLGWTHEKSRRHVSDHAPVYLLLGGAELDASEAVVGTQSSVAGPIRGNRSSRIYHRPDCPSYDTIGERNRVGFPDEAAALAAGYRLAGNCPD